MNKPRLIIADDHTLLAEAFEKLLAPACEIVGKVADGRALLTAVRELRPDVVVLDIAMPLLNGLDAGRQVKNIEPSTKLVFVTMNEDPSVAAEAFRAGASAYLLKRSAGSELLTAIREVMNRRSYVTPLITEGMVGSLMNPLDVAKPPHQLSARQRDKYRMMEQLGIRTSAELVQYAMRNHLV
jgi:DNA-binding NarL/FixJ family response regulator